MCARGLLLITVMGSTSVKLLYSLLLQEVQITRLSTLGSKWGGLTQHSPGPGITVF